MRKLFICLFFLFLLASCRDEYELPLRETDVSLLVVEGTLNAGQGMTTITLSRTVKVNDAATIKPVLRAALTVEGKNGGNYALNETGNGQYTLAQLPLTFGEEYRLRIRTADNKEYLSDYIVARQTPAIDAVTWKIENEKLIIYANSHDASNNTRYYKWDFDETWEIRSYYTAFYRWLSGTTIVPTISAYNSRCWKYAKSNTINVGSTVQLQSDVVSEAPVQFIPFGSEKLGVRYSILLKQQTLTREAYEYFNLMKKNTESIGSIFDPQPSELKGNIKCISNPDEGVLGFLTASSFTEKRIFITAQEANNWRFSQYCPMEKVLNEPDSIRIWVPGYLPFNLDNFNGVEYYAMAPASCVDCTKRGGDLNMPSYW
ncbi:MAG: DUF4249 domain-containing protein [Gammaproteobacteria bacterium]|nr:MAG: DUF4249 domain-containing protein [Gammaproteobacteria bacterium]